MTRTAVPIVIAAAVLAWGCGTHPSAAVTDPSKLKSLEARVAKLETELTAALAARDQATARAKTAEEKLAKEVARGAAVEKERDAVRTDLRARAAERDALQGQFDGFRKNLKDLLGQADAVTAPAPPTVPSPTALGTGSAARRVSPVGRPTPVPDRGPPQEDRAARGCFRRPGCASRA